MENYSLGRVVERNMDELIGLCKGIAADDIISQTEAEFLLQWIESHFKHMDTLSYPLSTIYSRLGDVLGDGILDSNEAKELLQLLNSFTGGKSLTDEVQSMSGTLPLDTPMPEIYFDQKKFCFTGQFTIGSRSTCSRLVQDKGGIIKKRPTLDTDYLIIGILGNEEWIHSTYGRKIESAIEMRDYKQTGIAIVSEEHFIKYL